MMSRLVVLFLGMTKTGQTQNNTATHVIVGISGIGAREGQHLGVERDHQHPHVQVLGVGSGVGSLVGTGVGAALGVRVGRSVGSGVG